MSEETKERLKLMETETGWWVASEKTAGEQLREQPEVDTVGEKQRYVFFQGMNKIFYDESVSLIVETNEKVTFQNTLDVFTETKRNHKQTTSSAVPHDISCSAGPIQTWCTFVVQV